MSKTIAGLLGTFNKAGNHEEAVLYLRPDLSRLSYHSIVVFQGQLWLSVGEQVVDRTRVMLVR